jgi:hypothetical protein
VRKKARQGSLQSPDLLNRCNPLKLIGYNKNQGLETIPGHQPMKQACDKASGHLDFF